MPASRAATSGATEAQTFDLAFRRMSLSSGVRGMTFQVLETLSREDNVESFVACPSGPTLFMTKLSDKVRTMFH